MKYDFNRLLSGSPDNGDSCFKTNIKIGPHRREHLEKLLKEVIFEIKKEFTCIREHITNEEFDGLNPTQKSLLLSLKPKFWPQGSFTYKTVNEPAHMPPQQVDIDVGMYLPMNFVEKEPSLSHTLMFSIIDRVLLRIASKRKSWKFIGTKPTCGRVETDKHAHIDVVAYAIPTEKFSQMVENYNQHKSRTIGLENISAALDSYTELDPTEVNMSHRTNGWIVSDPKEVSNWFNTRANQYTYLRSVCKYLKAWRDFQWPNGEGPSSIALMVMVDKAFSSSMSFKSDSDALITVVKKLPAILDNDVRLPVLPKGIVWPRTTDNKEEIILAVKALSASLSECQLFAKSKEDVVKLLRKSLGDRIPNRPDWVKETREEHINRNISAVILPQEHSKNTMAG